MKFRSTWILIIVLAAVAAYYFLVEERRTEPSPRPEGGSRNVLPYGREDVESIVLINPARERIVMERDGEEWMIVHPTRTKASNPTIDAFLLQVVPGLKLEEFPAVVDLGDYGFGDPYATVILTARGRSHPDTIHVGDKTPTSSRCYIRLGSSRNVVITRELTHNVMNKNIYHLRDKNLLHIEAGDIDRLTILNGAARITLVKRDGSWRLGESRLRADRTVVEFYLNALTSAIIRGFAREDLTGLGQFELTHPFRRLVIGTEETEIEIAFGRTEGRMVYAVRSGIDKVLKLGDDVLNIFSIGAEEFRAREITFVEFADIRGIRAEMADTVVAVTAGRGGWHLAGRDSARVDARAVARLLDALRRTRFEELFDATLAPPEIGSDAASISITLEDETGRAIDRILVSRSTAGYEFGSSTSAAAIGRLPDGTGERIRMLVDGLHR